METVTRFADRQAGSVSAVSTPGPEVTRGLSVTAPANVTAPVAWRASQRSWSRVLAGSVVANAARAAISSPTTALIMCASAVQPT